MSSQSDDMSRFESASEQARRNFEDARRQFDRGEASQEPKKPEEEEGGFAPWTARHVPGGQRTLWIVLGLILLVFIVWRILPGNNIAAPGFGANGPQPVGVAVASKGDIDVTLDALGTVTPLATVAVRPQVSGQVTGFGFQEGQMVKAGDQLAQIDPRSYQAALDQAKGTLARDTATLNNARLDLKRLQVLRKSNATSQQSLDTQATLVKQDEGVVMADTANVESANINLGYTRVTSPIAGRVGIRLVDLGNFVSAGQASGIVVVTQMDPMSVLFSIPEDNVDDVISRMKAGDTLEVDAYDRTQTTLLAKGKLSAVDSEIDTATGTVKLRALFDNPEDALFPNQFVNVRLLVNTLHGQVIVPPAAIQRGASGTYVFVVKPDHKVEMRTVSPGVQQGDRIAIVKGLNAGETVVTDGSDRLRDGADVTIPSGQKVAKVEAATNATPLAPGEAAHRGRFFALMHKLTPDECKQLAAMSREDRGTWFRDHRDELNKRPDQSGGTVCRLPGGGGFRMRSFGG